MLYTSLFFLISSSLPQSKGDRSEVLGDGEVMGLRRWMVKIRWRLNLASDGSSSSALTPTDPEQISADGSRSKPELMLPLDHYIQSDATLDFGSKYGLAYSM